MHTFLIGGGRDPDGVRASHAAFVAATGGAPVVAYALDEGDGIDAARWADALRGAGAGEVRVIAISPSRPATHEDLDGAGGVFVAGGSTPLYRAVLVDGGRAWLDRAAELGLPFGGFSAGAAVAATDAVVGGWRVPVGEALLPVCDEEAGEGLDRVERTRGLGLVPGCVDVHAAQWGTLGRAIGFVRAGLAREGWAIDEHTALELREGAVAAVHGVGAAHRLRDLGGGAVSVEALVA